MFIGIGVCIGLLSACTNERAERQGHERTEKHEAELALRMSRLQRWTHKTALALDAKNAELAEFYLHEMEETIDGIRGEVPVYEGYEIKRLTSDTLVPGVEALDRAVDARDWSAVQSRLQEVETACNQCHVTTDHGYVKVDLQDIRNPYIQDFSTAAPRDTTE